MVSILLPVFNGANYIEKAIESILTQSYRNLELIIIDDGSTDSTLEIITKIQERDPRIIFSSRDNRGLIATLNEMIPLAKGEYIARMDADDISYPERIASQVKFLEQHQEVVCVGGCISIIDHKGRLLTDLDLPKEDEEIQKMLLEGVVSICQGTVMLRKAQLLQVGGYDPTMDAAEDLDLWLRLGEVGKLANLPLPLLKYRYHTASLCHNSMAAHQVNARRACERAWKRRTIEGRFTATEQWRPGSSPASVHQYMLKYGWWAFNSCQRKTAVIYGLKAIQALPTQLESWKLLACALLKPMPKLADKAQRDRTHAAG